MSDPDRLLRSGDIEGTRAALVDVVRREPANEKARMFLFQLLAVAGQWEKCVAQLRTLAKIAAEAEMLAVLYSAAAGAEGARERVFAGLEPPHRFIASDWADGIFAAIGHLGRGDIEAAIETRDAAFDATPDMRGTIDGEPFEWITNADPRLGPCIEMIIDNRYGIQPLDQIARIESTGPQNLRDLVWQPAEVAFKSSQSVNVLLPVRYPNTVLQGSDQEKLARSTVWDNTSFGSIGCGTQLLTISSGEDIAITALRTLVFE